MDCTRQCYKLFSEDGNLPRKRTTNPQNNNLGCKVVMHLAEPFKKSGRNITCHNFFTSLELGRKLLRSADTCYNNSKK